MILSLEESLQRLKAEIIAQDWRLSHKRVEMLRTSFACLKERYKTRKGVYAILVMADNVLQYIKKRGDNSPPDCIDFLKEAMAHVVNFYEDPRFDPEKDEKLFRKIYVRFNTLKEKIREHKKKEAGGKKQPPQEITRSVEILSQAARESAENREIAIAPSVEELAQVPDGDPEADSDIPAPILLQPAEDQDPFEPAATITRHEAEDYETAPGVGGIANHPDILRVEGLVAELKLSLQKAEGVGSTIRALLEELLADQAGLKKLQRPVDLETDCRPVSPPSPIGQGVTEGPAEGAVDTQGITPPDEDEPPDQPIKTCPASELYQLTIGNALVYVPVNFVCAIRSIAPRKRETYLANSSVPVKDFSRFLQALAKQFTGTLASVKNNKLKKLYLPVMTLHGNDLPNVPDENASVMIVVSNGNWNGVILCSQVITEPKGMVKFQKAKNGDIAGVGFSAEGERLPLLNIVSVLRREGFLVMA